MQTTPINSLEPTKYLMKEEGTYFCVYRREEFLSADDLAGMSTSRAKELVLEKLKEFLSNDSEYRRIETYFKCLAFRPDAPELGGEA